MQALINGMRQPGCLLVVLALATGCTDAAELANKSSPGLKEHVRSLVRRCGLEGRMVYEIEGKEIRILGNDPRVHEPNFNGCFLGGFQDQDIFFGFVDPERVRFMGPAEANPDPGLLDEIEERLSRDVCIGDIGRWWREYAYRWEKGRVDTRTLHFALHKGWPGRRNPGRTVYDSDLHMVMDEGPHDTAHGSYEAGTGKLTLDHCGSNYVRQPRSKRLIP